jgi:hypothetical protein
MKLKYQKINLIIIVMALVLIGGMTLGYSALNQNLQVNTTVTVRAEKDMRLMSLSVPTLTNGASESYNGKFSEDTITTNDTLPNLNSTATYTVTLNNNNTVAMDVQSITTDVFNNTNMEYSIAGLTIGEPIEAGATVTFTVTFAYKNTVTTVPENTAIGSVLKFTFENYVARVTMLSYATTNQLVTSGNGLYAVGSNKYIYKGTSVDNYVKFSGDTAVYRILNFNADGSMKVIGTDFSNILAYDAGGNRTVAASPYCTNAATNGCNYFGTTTAASLSYTNNLAVTTDSTIKVYLDNWYTNLASTVKDKILLHDFNGGFVTYNQTPANMIAQTSNIIYTTHVALAGVDDFFNAFETLPTGNINTSVTYSGNGTNFMLNSIASNQQMWLLNASTYDTWDQWSLAYGSQFGQKRASRTNQKNGSITADFYVIPCFYVNSNLNVTGTGTAANPFIVS